MNAEDMITTAQAAEILGYSKRYVARLADRGRLTPLKKLDGLRGGYLFDREEVERFRAARIERIRAELDDLATAQPRAKAS